MLLAVGLFLLLGIAVTVIEAALRFASQSERTPSSGADGDVEASRDETFDRDLSALNAHAQGYARSSRDWRDVRLTFRAETINLVDGWRLTTDQPPTADRRVYLYGGSTVLCLEVRDDQTVSSHLQRRLSPIATRTAVLNRGISGATVSGSVASLDLDEITADDVVIVYFGLNDAKLNAYRQRGRGCFRLIPGWVPLLGLLRIRLRLRVAQWIWLETVTLDVHRQRNLSRARAETVRSTLDELNQTVVRRGAAMFAVLQPHIWLKPPSRTEQHLRARIASTTPVLLEYQYSAFRAALGDRPWFVDLSTHFEASNATLFTDWAHANGTGNARIADGLFAALTTRLDRTTE